MSQTDAVAFYERYWQDPDSAPPSHDPTTAVRKRMLADVIRMNFASLNGELAVDLGCGTGEFTVFLSELGFRPVGVDVSSKALAEARTRYPNLKFETIKDGYLPFSDSSVGLIWSSEVIEHVFDVMGWLAEANRSLKPGGIMILTTPYHGFFKMLVVSLINFGRHFDPLGSHIRFFDKRSLARCLLAAGLRPKVWCGYGRPWPFWKSFFVVAEKARIGSSRATIYCPRGSENGEGEGPVNLRAEKARKD